MALEIIKSYTTTLSQFFTLSDVSIAESTKRSDGEDIPIPSFVPAGSTVISTCYHAEKIVEDVNEFATDVMSVDISSEVGSALKGTLESLRWRLEEAIAATWARGQ